MNAAILFNLFLLASLETVKIFRVQGDRSPLRLFQTVGLANGIVLNLTALGTTACSYIQKIGLIE
jgi:hypothetical protein